MRFLVWAVLAGAVFAAPLSEGSCSEDCIHYLLTDAGRAKVLRLYRELLRPDSGSLLPIDINGQTYDVSYTKRDLIHNAVRKGIKESVIESMLDDAAIAPKSSSTRPITQQKVELIHERRPNHEPLSSGLRIYTNSKGDANVDVKGQTLRIPDDLTSLPQIVTETNTLNDIIRQLQELGVPIKRDGNRVTIGSSSSPLGLTLRLAVKKIDDKVTSVTVTVNDDKYTLPGDESRLNCYLAREPEVAYHIFKIFSTHGVPIEYDSSTKTLKTDLQSEEEILGSRTTLAPQAASPRISPKVIQVGLTNYYLPYDWDRLKHDIQIDRFPAGLVSDILEVEKIYAPDDVISLIRTKISNSHPNTRVKRYGDEVFFEIATQSYKLPGDQIALEKALKESFYSRELVRDSLIRVGIDSERIGSTLRVLMPGGDINLSDLPTRELYDYKIVPRSRGANVTAGSKVYNLPQDKAELESDIASGELLPRTLVDAFNSVGIPSNMDIDKQEMTVDLSSGTLRIPMHWSMGTQEVETRLRLSVRNHDGNEVYNLTVGDSGTENIELPSEVHVLNSYIRSGKVNTDHLFQMFSDQGISHRFDATNNKYIVTMNDRTYEIEKSK